MVRAGFERGVRGGATGAVPRGPERLDLGVRAARRPGRALADHLAVADEDAADPGVRRRGAASGAGQAQCPAHQLGVRVHARRPPVTRFLSNVMHYLRSVQGADDGRRRTSRNRHFVALSHPDSDRRPRTRTGSTTRLAAVGSRAPADRSADTAGRDFHPTPRASLGCQGEFSQMGALATNIRPASAASAGNRVGRRPASLATSRGRCGCRGRLPRRRSPR